MNDPAMVRHLVEALTELAAIGRNPLTVSGIYHFSVPTGSISTFPGWYVIWIVRVSEGNTGALRFWRA